MRNITDAFSNQVIFSPEQIRDWLPGLMQPEGRVPTDFLPAFLHEATHHWCFSSPVQTVITLLGMRARVEAFLAIEASTSTERARWEARAAEDLFRADTALEIYRPLAEGLATFAEFDTYTSRFNRTIPAPFAWAMRFYGRSQQTWARLIEVRLAEDILRRKESLLAQPLSCQDSGGYLAGYMTIRQMLRYLPGSWKADRFLQAAYRWFYEDEALIALLLDSSLRAPDSISAIYRYMSERILNGFLQAERVAEEYQTHTAEMSAGQPRTDNATIQGGEEAGPGFAARWTQAFADLPIDLTQPMPYSNFLAKIFSLVMQSRDLMLIGTLPCTADVQAGRVRIFESGRELTTLPALEPGQDAGISATLSVYFATRGGQRLITVSGSRSNLLAWSSEPEWSSALIEQSTRPGLDSNAALSIIVLGTQVIPVAGRLIDSHAKELSQLRELTRLDGFHSQTAAKLDDLYRRCALIDVADDQFGTVWSRMRNYGFYGLLDRNAEAVRVLALAGLYSSSGLIDDDGTFARIDTTPAAALTLLDPYAKRFKAFRISDKTPSLPGVSRVYCSI
jgi:hypothetical protein